MHKMFGIGPVGVIVSVGFLMMAVWLDRLLGHVLILSNPVFIRVLALVVAGLGLGLHAWSMWVLRRWWLKNQLCTTGPFRWFRHPLYAAWITFILPGAALLFNSWVVLSFVALIHLAWHQLVKYEEKAMHEKFQNEYRDYAARTGRFFPRISGCWPRVPLKKKKTSTSQSGKGGCNQG